MHKLSVFLYYGGRAALCPAHSNTKLLNICKRAFVKALELSRRKLERENVPQSSEFDSSYR